MKRLGLWALFAVAATLHAGSLPWHWSNPLPFGNDVVGLAWRTNAAYVAVCDHGRMYASVDLVSWAEVSSGTTKDFQAAAYFGARLVAVGAAGLAWWADDLSAPHVVDLGTADWLVGLAVSPTTAVAVGDNGAAYASTDGAVWTKVSTGITAGLKSVAWSGSMFAAVGSGGTVATSADGLNWTAHSSGTTANLNGVAWTGLGFTAVGDGGLVLQSALGGSTWLRAAAGASGDLIAATAGPGGLRVVTGYNELRVGAPTAWLNELDSVKALPAPSTDYYALLWDGTHLVAAGEAGEIVTGVPGTPGYELNWTPFSSPPRTWLFDMATVSVAATNVSAIVSNQVVGYRTARVTNSLYVAVGDLGTILNSDDGVLWVSALAPTNTAAHAFLGVAGNPSGMLAVGAGGAAAFSAPGFTPLVTTNVVTNAHGSTAVLVTNQSPTLGSVWKTTASPTAGNLLAAAASDGLFVVAGDGGFLATSPDAAHWSPRATGVGASLSGLAAWPRGFVAVGDLGTILSSADGAVWVNQSQPTTNWIYRVRWSGGRLVAVGENGTIYTSGDGAAWTPQPSGVTNWLNDVAWVNGAYYAVGDQGIVLSSTNGSAWSIDTNLFTGKSLYAAATLGNQLIVGGYEGVVLRAQTAAYTTPVDVVSWPGGPTNQVFLFSGAVDQTFKLERSTDLLTWTNEIILQITDPSGVQAFVDGQTNNASRQWFRTVTIP